MCWIGFKWEECSAVVWCQSPWRAQDCIARKEVHPVRKGINFISIYLSHTYQSENQPQTPEPVWVSLLLHVKNLIIHNVSMCLGWCPPLWSYQGSSESSNTKSCGCRLVGDEQGYPGDQRRGHWPKFCYRTRLMLVIPGEQERQR